MTGKGAHVQRDGDTWLITWADYGIGMGLEHLRDSSDGIKAEVTIESSLAGRLLGPNWLNLLSTRSQAEFATRCFKRANTLPADVWDGMFVYACAVVVKQWRAPTPIIDLSQVPDTGPIRFLDSTDRPGIIPMDETTIVYGDGESAKSLFCLQFSLCVALGRELPWGARPARCNVLYLDWETNANTVASRLRRLSLGEACETPQINYRQCFRSLSDELPDIREQISKRHIGLVVVDSIGFAATGALVEDQTARSAMNDLRQMTPATRLVVAHISKGSADSPGTAKPFGSNFFWNGMRSGVEIRRGEEPTSDNVVDIGVFHRKSNDGVHQRPFGLSAIFEECNRGIQFVPTDLSDVPDLAARTPLSSRIRNMLRNGKQSTKDLARDLEIGEDVVRVTLTRMSGVSRLEAGGGRGKPSVWGLAEEKA